MKRVAQIAFSCVVGLALVWLLFRDTDWRAVAAAIREVDVLWLVVAQLFSWSTHFARVQRWSYVVRAGHEASYRSLMSATQIGFLVNFLIPARVGEGVRAYVLARLEKLPLSRCVAMVALDRVSDVFALLVILLVALIYFPVGGEVEIATGILGNSEPIVISGTLIETATKAFSIALVAALLLLVTLYLKQDLVCRILHVCVRPVSKGLDRRLQRMFVDFAEGMHIFRSGSDMAKSGLFSLVTWGGGILSLTSVLIAFHMVLPWYTAVIIVAMISVFIIVPVTPGMVGQFHIPIVACLLILPPGADPDHAKAVAILAHALGMIPVGALGLYCMFRERMNFPSLIRKAQKAG